MLRLTGIFRPLLVFVVAFGMFLSAFTAGNASTTVREIEGNYEAYSKVPPAAKNTNPRTTANTRPYNPNGRLNPV